MDILVMTQYTIKKNIKFTLSTIVPAIILAFISKSLLVGAFVYVFNLELSAACYFDKRSKMFKPFWINAFLLLAVSYLAFAFSETRIIALVTLMILTFISFYAQNFPKYLRAPALRYGAVNFLLFSFKISTYKHYAIPLMSFGIAGILIFYFMHYYILPERNFLYTENSKKISVKLKLTNDRFFENIIEILTHGMNLKSERFIKRMDRHIRKVLSQLTLLDSTVPINQKILEIFQLHYNNLKCIEILKNVIVDANNNKWLPQNYTPFLYDFIREYQAFYNAETLIDIAPPSLYKIKHQYEVGEKSAQLEKLIYALEVLELNRAKLIILFKICW